MLELDDLHAFVRIAETGGVSAAARALDLPKSSVSRSLSRLETMLGTSLFERSARDLRLTESGEAFLPHARRVLADVDEAANALDNVLGTPRGLLRVKSTYSIAQELIAPMLPAFCSRYPKIRVALNAASRRDDTSGDEADLVIRLGPPPDAGSAARRLASVELWACASPAYLARRGTPHTVADLSGHDLIGVRERMRWAFAAAGGEPASIEFAPRLIVPEPATAQVLIAGGAAIGRLPDYLAAAAVARGTLVRLFGDLLPDCVEIYAVAQHGRSMLERARVFADALATYLATARRSAGARATS